jgi:hypothetical protein
MICPSCEGGSCDKPRDGCSEPDYHDNWQKEDDAGATKPGEWTVLSDLRNGAIFETRDGVIAVKTRYRSRLGAIDCYLLASGESAWFDQPANRPEVHNATEAREIPPLAIPCGTVAASVAVVAEWGKFLANVANGHVNVLAVESAIRRLEEELFE